jgi:hypothetical protein
MSIRWHFPLFSACAELLVLLTDQVLTQSETDVLSTAEIEDMIEDYSTLQSGVCAFCSVYIAHFVFLMHCT